MDNGLLKQDLEHAESIGDWEMADAILGQMESLQNEVSQPQQQENETQGQPLQSTTAQGLQNIDREYIEANPDFDQNSEDFILRGIPQEQHKGIMDKAMKEFRNSSAAMNPLGVRKHVLESLSEVADFERLKTVNPVLAEEIDLMTEGGAALAAAGKSSAKFWRGLGVMDQADDFEKIAANALTSRRKSAAAAEFTADVAPFVTPFGVAARVPSVAGRAVATGAVGATEGAIAARGEGGDAKDVVASAAISGALSGLTGGVIKALPKKESALSKMIALRKSPKAIVEKNPLVEAAEEAGTAAKIRLFKGQKTLDAPTLERQSFVQQLPAGVQKASKELALQNKESSAAVDSFLSAVAPDDAIVKGANKFRSASRRAIELRKQAREQASDPLYKRAFTLARKSGLNVDVNDLAKESKAIAEGFPSGGEVSRSFTKINKWLADAAKDKSKLDVLRSKKIRTPSNLSALHNAKLEIDQMLSKNFDGSLGNTTKMKLVEIKNNLVSRMNKASPEYDVARKKFHELSPEVDAIEDSIIGSISRIKDTQLKQISTKIFDPQNANIKVVRDAKRIISEVDPDAWKMLARSEIERRMGTMKSEIGGSIENIPGKLHRSIFGNARQKGVLLAGFEGEALKNLKHLDVALKRASLGRALGSQTASRTEITKELRGGIAQTLRDLFRAPVSKIVETGENIQFDSRVKAMTEALFDPEWSLEAGKLMKKGKGKELGAMILAIEAANLAGSETQETQESPQL